ncbi:malate dehydrogenase [Penicillium coprophilum]|uniref:malate dehydrogenase n=1 Tax=Penicillium coprophilum TaxID=36646 RepID=UPI0023907A32|nr:malate dehydrogenase [Penicillium coprophilum]KAJ5164058.1 malate dehydrogenase [Penicillium coprophilum]
MKFLLALPLLLGATSVEGHSGLPQPLALASSFSHIYHQLGKINIGNCSLANVSLPLSATKLQLPVPSKDLTLKYVALGRGTQNYTCPSNASSDSKTTIKPKATGAAATLFDASCIASSSLTLLHEIPAIISATPLESLAFMATLMAQSTRSTNLIIGEHYFDADGEPIFDMELSGSKSWIAASKIASSPAPKSRSKSSDDVPWLKLGHKKGKGIQVGSSDPSLPI